jgi:hypothetical protein
VSLEFEVPLIVGPVDDRKSRTTSCAALGQSMSSAEVWTKERDRKEVGRSLRH